MSLLRNIRRSVTEDVTRIAKAPLETAREVRYTTQGLIRGEIPPRRVASTVVATLGALVLVTGLMFPVIWVSMSAISSTGGSIYASGGFQLLPDNPTLKPFVWVLGDLAIPALSITISIPFSDLAVAFNTPKLLFLDASEYGVTDPSSFKKYLWNSLTVAIPTVILGMCLIVPGAYALSRREFIMRRKLLFGYVLFTQVGGGLGIAALIALYAMFVQVGLNNNKLALAVYYAATAVPFNTWLLKTYMDGIPVSYEEAAIVDGAPPWRVVTEVIIPLSAAGLATVFIFTFLTGWTEFVVAQTLLGTDKYTLPVGLFSLVGEYSIPWARFSAFALTFASPIVLVYLFAQRYIEGGLSFGGMEG